MRAGLRALVALTASLAVGGCSAAGVTAPSLLTGAGVAERQTSLPPHAVIGFSVDTPKRVARAARQGVTATILYGGSPAGGSALQEALHADDIAVIDGEISGVLFYWECHRTHTVKPPPKNYGHNPYCRTDEDPHIDSVEAALREVGKILTRDAKRRYVAGYWVLDDWAWWDPGSGRALLQKVHALIAQRTPGLPAICGFGAGIARPGKVHWDPGTGANYSNDGCDIVGWYNYSPFGNRHKNNGKHLDWTMKALLPAMAATLEKRGWRIARTPLYGIGQAWGGSYDKKYYQPGLTRGEMLAQAKAFCDFGASYIGWYAWDDSGFESRTETPNNSRVVSAGIAAGLNACRSVWQPLSS